MIPSDTRDPLVIVLLLPAIACGLWIGVGGLVTGMHRGGPGRLLLEKVPLFLLAGEGAFAFDFREQVPVIGDLVDDVVDEVGKMLRGKRPRRR